MGGQQPPYYPPTQPSLDLEWGWDGAAVGSHLGGLGRSSLCGVHACLATHPLLLPFRMDIHLVLILKNDTSVCASVYVLEKMGGVCSACLKSPPSFYGNLPALSLAQKGLSGSSSTRHMLRGALAPVQYRTKHWTPGIFRIHC